ncbi:BAG family molecular chaperone regulator [Aspergillus affinis]|uniref:BAG family molecular chaperone regulator n=1 Tax=Aspergillus affinis TaxID=1070780 RepID=UPI0022FEC450|nr:uncharacterized protein KD926_004717 [Aspergillus affinis]KAI9042927.1 hypothetical protein KD926_004717 [Aspergillus affinis]
MIAMEISISITETAQQCIQGLEECLAIPALMENEWAENRLADMNLWISGTGACARGKASLDSRLASKPEARDVITNLLRLLATVIDECKTRCQEPGLDSIQESPQSLEETSGRAFSPWSDDSSSDDESDDGDEAKFPSKIPLQESMYNVESMEDQLARIAVAIRRSGRRSRLQKADQRFDPTEHEELEGYLIAMLLTQLKRMDKTRDASALNEVQLRLVRCNLKRRNRFLYAQRHSKGLDGGIGRRSDKNAAVNRDGSVIQDDIIDHGEIKNLPKLDHQNPNSTVITGTSASALSDSFMMPLTAPAAPAASSIMSSTVIDLDYPHPPRFHEDAHLFRCPCCCEAIPVAVADKNKWRKHVADDLSPYTCILTGCNQPDVLFNTKEAWKQHLLKDHGSMTYWICFACGNGARYYSKEHFIQHTRSSHASSIPSDQIPSLVDICKKSTPRQISHCPLCDWPDEGVEVEKDALLNHIAKEIHSFSLRALPWADDNGEESEERIHHSSRRVHNWLFECDSQQPSSDETPSFEKTASGLGYFQQNPYFAGSSRDSFSSEPESDGSRQMELEELRKHEELRADKSHQDDKTQSQAQDAKHDVRLGTSLGWDLWDDFKPSPDLMQFETPLEQVNALATWFQKVMIPLCEQYVEDPPDDPTKRRDEYTKLYDTMLAQVFLKADGLDMGGNEVARGARRDLIKEGQEVLTKLESVRDEELKMDGQCPHPECDGHIFRDLKAHMLTHQTDRPEKCPVGTCDYHFKGFARKYDWNRHVMTHYKGAMVCTFCSRSVDLPEKTFNRADVFKRHLTSVHGVEQMPPKFRKDSVKKGTNCARDATGKCSICLMTFSNAQEFYEHLDECVLRAVQESSDTEVVSSYDADADAHAMALELSNSTNKNIDNKVLIRILPNLSSNEVLLLRQAYKNRVKLNGKGVNLAKHLALKLGTSNFGKVCHATALGRWESEAYYVTRYYEESPYRRELLIEALLGRSNNEIRQIKECFRDPQYHSSLERLMRSNIREGNFQQAILLVLEERRQDDSEPYDMELVGQDVTDLYHALHSDEDGENAMINIIVARSNPHLRGVLHLYEASHGENFMKAMSAKSNNLVGEALAHILNGATNRPLRDAVLLYQAICEPPTYDYRSDLMTSRLVRLHWEPQYLELVKYEYRKQYNETVEQAIAEQMESYKDIDLRDFCIELVSSSV